VILMNEGMEGEEGHELGKNGRSGKHKPLLFGSDSLWTQVAVKSITARLEINKLIFMGLLKVGNQTLGQ